MKLHTNSLRVFTAFLAVMMIFSCLAGTVTASAAANSMDILLATGPYQDQTIGVYTGQMQKDQPNGTGVIEYEFGATFEGTFKNGYPAGQGKYVSKEGAVFEGNWSWGTVRMSLDTKRYGSSMSYTGLLCDGKACGMGELTLEKCGTFYGEFSAGNADGWGIYAYAAEDETPLIGNDWEYVKNSRKHGQTYTGLTLGGQWQGFGLCITSSGGHYVGEIRSENRHGYGRLYRSKNKLSQEGIFQNGKLAPSSGASSSSGSGSSSSTDSTDDASRYTGSIFGSVTLPSGGSKADSRNSAIRIP